MQNRQARNGENRQWRLLLIYDTYRIVSVLLFLSIYFYNFSYSPDSILFFTILFVYFIFTLIFFYFGIVKSPQFDRQVFLSGTIDVMAISSMLSIIGNMQTGYGILLNVTIAALSILVPGRLAIFFAALASCLLLCGNLIQFIVHNQKDLGTFYYSGIYGAGFFATAITAWYLSNWVQISEKLAQHRSEELAGMQRINEYIVERLHSGIVYVDETRQIKLINSAARGFFNLSKKRLPVNLKQLSTLLDEKFDHFLLKNKLNSRIAQTVIEDPYLKIHFFSTAVANNPAVLIILEDMTSIAQQAQQLKLASLGRFSASIAHEVRNPLGAIAHAAQLLGYDQDLGDEDARLKQLIINNCDRMNGVIKNILQLTRQQQSQPQINDIVTFLEQFKHDFCRTNQCDLKLEFPEKQQISVVFDKSQLEQIMVILCDNAMQHGIDEEGHITITIAVKSYASRILLTISDLGPGVPPEHRDNIFEPFFTTLRTGTGMGLFLARDLCEINQARLNLVKSSKGSCFAITLNSSDELLI